MESLPSDTLLDILSRVPTECVLECKLVCKKWQDLIRRSGTYFTNMHSGHLISHLCDNDGNNISGIGTKVQPSLFFACRSEEINVPTWLFYGGKITDKISINERYSYKENLKKVDHPPMHRLGYEHFVGSCNGLICVCIHHHRVLDPIYIFNPITKEYVYLPELMVEPSEDMSYPYITEEGEVNLIGRVSAGFGYVRSTNEYKIVRIHYPRTIHKGHVEVYTLGKGCGWRNKGIFSIRLMIRGAGIYVNGALYWAGEKIVAFDLASEEFHSLPFPPCMINCVRTKDSYGLVALGGNLCFFLEKSSLEIWSMKKRGHENSDEEEIWCLDFDISFESVTVCRKYSQFRPVLLTETGEIILIFDESALYCYNPTTTAVEMISDDDEVATEYFASVRAIPHINTFVSLEAMGEKSKRYLVGEIWEGKEPYSL